ncbi:hypothetical protein KI387_020825 [Taxus chinensis]|uniref:Uncharacterized protein n=1 Tax=Taxus chinensis TaxID=29808 RepID=A0AA38LCH5_TAXCH|nr:hypothetical protein KI387_020825 [Taxus chinensis]
MGICLSKRDAFVQQRRFEDEVISGNTKFPVEPSSIYELGMDGTNNHEVKNEYVSTWAVQSSQQQIDLEKEIRKEKICDSCDYKWKDRLLTSGLPHILSRSTEMHGNIGFRCKSQQESTARRKDMMIAATHGDEKISDGLDTHRFFRSSFPFTKSCRITTQFGNSETRTSPSKLKGSLTRAKSLVKRMSPRRRILNRGQYSHRIEYNSQIVNCFSPEQLKLKDVGEDNARSQCYKCTQTTADMGNAVGGAPFNTIESCGRSELEYQCTSSQEQCRTSLSFSDSGSDLFELEFVKRDLALHFAMDS